MQGQAPACPNAARAGVQRLRGQGRPQAVAQRCSAPLTLEEHVRRLRAAPSDRRGRPRRRLTNTEAPHPDGGKWPHLVNGVGGSAAGRTGAFAFYVSQVRTPLLHGLKTVVPPVDQGSAVGRGYGPAPPRVKGAAR